MVLRGCAPACLPAAPRSRSALAPLAAALLLTIAGLTATSTASATGLPPVKITYAGTMSLEVFPTQGKPAHQVRSLSWTATANSAGSDGTLALDFSSVGGSASTEGNGNCYDETAQLSLAAAMNPVAGGWTLGETSSYPNRGWKYIALGVPAQVPILEAVTGKCSSVASEALVQTNEMLLKQETFSPAQLAAYEALFDPLEFTPGTPATRTRTFSFDGMSHCTCLPDETHVKESMTLTVGATSPAAGNNIKTEPARSGGQGTPKGPPTRRKEAEARRKQLKEQARADLGPALEEAWKAHGLSAALGLNYGVALSTVLDELGQSGSLLESNDATARAINDYRIINDPPDRRVHQFARPRGVKPPALITCTAATVSDQAVCTRLRTAELAMLTSSAKATSISAALLVTINRDSAAIRSRDYSAAERQYVHFRSLHSELVRALKGRGSAGAQVAAILHSLNVSGALSSAQSTAAISAVEASLSRAHVPIAKLRRLAGAALDPRQTDALASLASPRG